jgi:anti-sigma regulatory factor (Ser/Thr protein kinase)
MPREHTVKPATRLTLESRLDRLTLLRQWVDALAAEYAIPADTQFGIHLCLEEALSNIVGHGYGGQPNHAITVECTVDCAPGGVRELAFIVEDQAPPFDPLAPSTAEEAPAPRSIGELRPGGQGIRLLRKFAGSLAYQRLPGGNRLTIRFALPR